MKIDKDILGVTTNKKAATNFVVTAFIHVLKLQLDQDLQPYS